MSVMEKKELKATVPTTKGKKLDLFRLILIMGLGACFLAQVWRQLVKFYKRDTTFTSTKLSVDHLLLPAISICAYQGFKYEEMANLGMTIDQWVLDEMNERWRRSTYSVEELVKSISFVDHEQKRLHFEVAAVDTPDIRIVETNNLEQGRCYTMNLMLNYRKKFQFMTVRFKIPEAVKALNLYIHDSGEEIIGLAGNYWVQQPFSILIEPDHRYNFELNKEIQILDAQRNCTSHGSNHHTNRCILQEIVKSDCVECHYPYYSPFDARNQSLKICAKISELRQIRNCIAKTIGRARVNTCHDSCSLTRFGVQWRANYIPGTPTNETLGFFYFKEVEEEIKEEYRLFDFGAILAAVGGSMGLFLGFSFLDCGVGVRNWVRSSWKK
ncbi:hypothetical protein TCAL_14322 [Tigriopus californicus]|uniref:Uncharacterized protein n=1 Tax=Tigriopus californicus TaxID=6832 RepID=A0A553NEM9_TIGCA|nr:hypothetical protein TCAL_14322 [Tigriopus californicus]